MKIDRMYIHRTLGVILHIVFTPLRGGDVVTVTRFLHPLIKSSEDSA